MNNTDKYITIKEASDYATQYVGKEITESNIAYLIQYGRINKVNSGNTIMIVRDELKIYYDSYKSKKEINWKNKLGDDLNWQLSFDNYREAETTKHVHRLHPYKGKFIPQLVEYFLDSHTDFYKKDIYFKPGDIILDPFCGSGTTLVQANELGMNCIGIDISRFNAMIANVKVRDYDIVYLERLCSRITVKLTEYEQKTNVNLFENELLTELYKYNSIYFPSPEFKKQVYNKTIDENLYAKEKAIDFLPAYFNIAQKYGISTTKITTDSFIEKWYFETARNEIYYVNDLINMIDDIDLKQALQIILSRTIRSCRATTHSDLATLQDPVYTTYYCTKHKKICKPLFSILKWWTTYSNDTIARLREFQKLKTATTQFCIDGDSTETDIGNNIEKHNSVFAEYYKNEKIKGIFSSPPYVGLIDYHEQHAYAYELFGFERKDNFEIGSMSLGSGIAARRQYTDDISKVLINAKKYLCENYEVFLVANDKFNLYPEIAKKASMTIKDTFLRPVLNRSENDKAYSETIFRLKRN